MPIRLRHISFCLLLGAALCGLASPCFALEDDLEVLQMFYDDRDLQVSVTRNSVPLSSIAENVTVITAEEIRAMNAHTVAEILANVTGLQQELRGAPGAGNPIYIRGGNFNHIRVIFDGVTLNNLSSNYPDLDSVPANIVERIEVMKGPASSSWGAALNGVINIVTKAPREETRLAGSGYVSGGSSSFRDVNLQVSGSAGPFGYFLHGGSVGDRGLTAESSVNNPSLYGKMRWLLADQGDVTASILYVTPKRENGVVVHNQLEGPQLFASLSARYTLLKNLEAELSSRFVYDGFRRKDFYPPELGSVVAVINGNGRSFGGTALLRWRDGLHALAAGFDYDTGGSEVSGSFAGQPTPGIDRHLSKYGIFLTDTLSLGAVSITPSVRYDWTSDVAKRDNLSLSLGAAWQATTETVVRVSAAKGYSVPEIVENRNEKIISLQAGVESSEVPYLWLRASYFYNFLQDVRVSAGVDGIRRHGGEIEVRTVPVFNTSLTTGVLLMRSESTSTGKSVKGEPTESWNIGVRYDDRKTLQVNLLGRYVWWNASSKGGPFNLAPDYEDFLWDLHVTKKFFVNSRFAPELFFSLHNIFDGNQYLYRFWKNPGRWAEGGVRFSF